MKIGIIGGGASGLFAAINVKNDNNQVIIFEKEKVCGKKLLSTGNGRCNYWNEDQSLIHYQSENKELLDRIINIDTSKKVLEVFDKLGIIPKIKNGYYYPFSNQASTILNVLLDEVSNNNVQLKTEFLVTDIKKENNGFTVSNGKEKIFVDKLIVSTGSFASYKMECKNTGYNFLKDFGHSIIKVLPALVQLKVEGSYLKRWAGIRTDVKMFLYEEDKLVREESGEIQLTDYGISGICTFNLSNTVVRGLDKGLREKINIDFLPFIEGDKQEWFVNQTIITKKSLKKLMYSVLNSKLVDVILNELGIDSDKMFTDYDIKMQKEIIKFFTSFKVLIKGSNSFEKAQICSGGIPLSEVNLMTMESNKVKDLYILGELLDIAGDCGGYNLGAAWRSGIIVGEAIGK